MSEMRRVKCNLELRTGPAHRYGSGGDSFVIIGDSITDHQELSLGEVTDGFHWGRACHPVLMGVAPPLTMG